MTRRDRRVAMLCQRADQYGWQLAREDRATFVSLAFRRETGQGFAHCVYVLHVMIGARGGMRRSTFRTYQLAGDRVRYVDFHEAISCLMVYGDRARTSNEEQAQ